METGHGEGLDRGRWGKRGRTPVKYQLVAWKKSYFWLEGQQGTESRNQKVTAGYRGEVNQINNNDMSRSCHGVPDLNVW